MKYKGIIFDMDGVIIDSNKFHYKAWKAVADTLGLTKYTYEDNSYERGIGRQEGILRLAGLVQKTLSDDEIHELETLKNNVYWEQIQNLGKDQILFGDVESTLIELKNRGYRLALGSSSKNALTIMQKVGLTSYFDYICDGMMVQKAKPDPEIFIRCQQGLNLDNNELVIVEDSLNGVMSAKNAQIDVITKDIPDQTYPVCNISSLSDLLKIL